MCERLREVKDKSVMSLSRSVISASFPPAEALSRCLHISVTPDGKGDKTQVTVPGCVQSVCLSVCVAGVWAGGRNSLGGNECVCTFTASAVVVCVM